MNQIEAKVKTVKEILHNTKYTLDFFQREYRWQREHVAQLLDDLCGKFLANYDKTHQRKDVQNYSRYYLGSIILSRTPKGLSIIDGQQRLTTLTLLLIYLNHLQKSQGENENVPILDHLIFSQKYGEKSFNLDIPERKKCMEMLYTKGYYENGIGEPESESVQNIIDRYNDIEELFPQELKEEALLYFIDWLIENVIFVEIITDSDDEAYTIFETMNDRGLSLTPSEMLKGYIISKLSDIQQKQEVNELWKSKIQNLKNIDKEKDLEFFKAWLRAKYAESIRPEKRGVVGEDFEKIGSRFHQWVRENERKIGLNNSKDFYNFVIKNMKFYSDIYEKILTASSKFNKDLESVFYVNQLTRAYSLFYPLVMAPINLEDDQETIIKKVSLVSKYFEMFLVFRNLNYQSCAQNAIRYSIYSLVKEIRNKSIKELVQILKQKAKQIDKKLEDFNSFRLYPRNKFLIKILLARITTYIEEKSGMGNKTEDYLLSNNFEIEHIWPDKFEAYRDEFSQKEEFEDWRNKLGALLLLPKVFNQSYGALPYEKKLQHYFSQNLLARTLHPNCYENNPAFLKFKEQYQLPFKPHLQFKKNDISQRQELYKKILEKIYDPSIFDETKV